MKVCQKHRLNIGGGNAHQRERFCCALPGIEKKHAAISNHRRAGAAATRVRQRTAGTTERNVQAVRQVIANVPTDLSLNVLLKQIQRNLVLNVVNPRTIASVTAARKMMTVFIMTLPAGRALTPHQNQWR